MVCVFLTTSTNYLYNPWAHNFYFILTQPKWFWIDIDIDIISYCVHFRFWLILMEPLNNIVIVYTSDSDEPSGKARQKLYINRFRATQKMFKIQLFCFNGSLFSLFLYSVHINVDNIREQKHSNKFLACFLQRDRLCLNGCVIEQLFQPTHQPTKGSDIRWWHVSNRVSQSEFAQTWEMHNISTQIDVICQRA